MKYYTCHCGFQTTVSSAFTGEVQCARGHAMAFRRDDAMDAIYARSFREANGMELNAPEPPPLGEPKPPAPLRPERVDARCLEAYATGRPGEFTIPLPPCNHEAELSALRESRDGVQRLADRARLELEKLRGELSEAKAVAELRRGEVEGQARRYCQLEKVLAVRDSECRELRVEFGRQALELRRAGRK